MTQQNIILTGFMGTGKSTVGRLLAERLQMRFVDTDDLIAARDGRSIADIFREDGEPAFRQWERTIAQELAVERGLVIATGGRLMLDAQNAAALAGAGLVFCLTAEPEEILARLSGDDLRRPLLEVPDPTWQIRNLLHKRTAGYGRFPQINTSGKTADTVAREIVVSLGADILTVSHPNGRYNVTVGHNLLAYLRLLAGIKAPIALITDSNVGPLHAARCGDVDCLLTVPAGEKHKTLATVNALYSRLLAAGIDRKGVIVALGGGVVGDMAGFVAASYMRGVHFVQCPTSLLAMVDASVGGKTGVDLPEGKNLVGAFKQPLAVLADLDTLRTLPPDEFAAGMAEVVKHGLIKNPELFLRLSSGDWRLHADNAGLWANLQNLVSTAIQIKRDVVQEDPFEQGCRAHLNLGHTFAHAIEKVSRFEVGHGAAVGMGLAAAAHMSAALGHCDAELQARVGTALECVGLTARIPADLPPQAIYQAMFSDKKKADGRLFFVLLHDVGDVFMTADVAETAVLNTLSACQQK